MKTLAWSAGYLFQLLRQSALLWLLPVVVWVAGFEAEQGRELIHAILEEEPIGIKWYFYLLTSSLAGIFLYIGQKWFSFFYPGRTAEYGDPAEYASSSQKIAAWKYHDFLQQHRRYFQQILAGSGLLFPTILTSLLLCSDEFTLSRTGCMLSAQLLIALLVFAAAVQKTSFPVVSARIFLQGFGRLIRQMWFGGILPASNSLLPPSLRKKDTGGPAILPKDSGLQAHSFFELSEAWQGGFGLMSIGSVLLLICLNCLEIEGLNAVGAASILWLGVSIWTCFFMWMLLLHRTTYLPVYLVLLVGLAYALIGGKEYPVRLESANHRVETTNLEKLLAQRIQNNGWQDRVRAIEAGQEEKIPLIILASDGGGMRSGYWTALQWENVREKWGPETDKHTFACVALSGGALGAVAYHLARNEKLDAAEARNRYRQLFESDLLAAQSRAFVSAENLTAFTPFSGGEKARDKAFEQAIRLGLEQSFPKARLDWPLPAQGNFSPLLLFQATEVETGAKTLISSEGLEDNTFPTDRILAEKTGKMALETAVHLGARVPVFSPPGAIPFPDGLRHFVDGGYYARGVSEVCLDLVKSIEASPYGKYFQTIVVYATNEMDIQNLSGFEVGHHSDVPKTILNSSVPGDWRGHFHALVSSSSANEARAKKQLIQHLRQGSHKRFSYLETQLQQGKKAIPMNWYLSNEGLYELEVRSQASRKFLPGLRLNALIPSKPDPEVIKPAEKANIPNPLPASKPTKVATGDQTKEAIHFKTHPHLYYYSKRLKKWRLIKDADFNVKKLKPIRQNRKKKEG